jgi:hypothetical protein
MALKLSDLNNVLRHIRGKNWVAIIRRFFMGQQFDGPHVQLHRDLSEGGFSSAILEVL